MKRVPKNKWNFGDWNESVITFKVSVFMNSMVNKNSLNVIKVKLTQFKKLSKLWNFLGALKCLKKDNHKYIHVWEGGGEEEGEEEMIIIIIVTTTKIHK